MWVYDISQNGGSRICTRRRHLLVDSQSSANQMNTPEKSHARATTRTTPQLYQTHITFSVYFCFLNKCVCARQCYACNHKHEVMITLLEMHLHFLFGPNQPQTRCETCTRLLCSDTSCAYHTDSSSINWWEIYVNRCTESERSSREKRARTNIMCAKTESKRTKNSA